MCKIVHYMADISFAFDKKNKLFKTLGCFWVFFAPAAHQLHQPSVRHALHGRPQQPQLSRQHRRKEGAPLPGRRGHERPAGVEPRATQTFPTLPRPARPTDRASALSLFLSLSHLLPLQSEKKSNKKMLEHCIKCIK